MTLPKVNEDDNRRNGIRTRSSRSIVDCGNVVKKRLPTKRKSSVKISKQKSLSVVGHSNLSTDNTMTAKRPRVVNDVNLSMESPPQLFIDEGTVDGTEMMESGEMDLSDQTMQPNKCDELIPILADSKR